jgi:hypothetical protein
MKHGQCPKCEGELNPFGRELFMFPFSFFCTHCKVKLKLTSWGPLILVFVAYLTLMSLVIFNVPALNVYGLSVILGLAGFFVVFYALSGYILNKDNLKSIE